MYIIGNFISIELAKKIRDHLIHYFIYLIINMLHGINLSWKEQFSLIKMASFNFISRHLAFLSNRIMWRNNFMIRLNVILMGKRNSFAAHVGKAVTLMFRMENWKSFMWISWRFSPVLSLWFMLGKWMINWKQIYAMSVLSSRRFSSN